MHEFAVTRQLLEIVLEEAAKASLQEVSQIKIVIGTLRGFVPDSIQFYFEFYSKETVAENATLTILEKEAKAQCKRCNHEFVLEEVAFFCEQCGHQDLNILQGKEFYLDSISGD